MQVTGGFFSQPLLPPLRCDQGLSPARYLLQWLNHQAKRSAPAPEVEELSSCGITEPALGAEEELSCHCEATDHGFTAASGRVMSLSCSAVHSDFPPRPPRDALWWQGQISAAQTPFSFAHPFPPPVSVPCALCQARPGEGKPSGGWNVFDAMHQGESVMQGELSIGCQELRERHAWAGIGVTPRDPSTPRNRDSEGISAVR